MTTGSADARRPPVAIRALIGVVGVAMLAFNAALMISDRAPALTQRLFGDLAQRLSDRLDASEAVDSGRLPDGEAAVHIGVWAVAAVLVALTVWRWSALVPVAAAVFVGSLVVEIGQGRYSSTRSVEMIDVISNGVGVGLGIALAATCMLVWNVVSPAAREGRRPSR